MEAKCKRVILLGAPGCGKGTQSAWLKEELGFVHLSTGDLLREAVAEGTEVGKRAKEIMSQGSLVPDPIVLGIVQERLMILELDPDVRGFILDGFPRTVAQAEGLDKIMESHSTKVDAVIYFDCPDEILKERVCGRRVHPASGRTYHIVYQPPKVNGLDDITGDPLVHRPDDNEDVFVARLSAYKRITLPLIEYYTKRQVLHTVAADLPAGAVRQELEYVLKLIDDDQSALSSSRDA